MKKLEDFLVTGIYEEIGDSPSPAMLKAYTRKYQKQGYNPTEAETLAQDELSTYRELGKKGFKGGKQLISSGPQFDVSTEQGRAEKVAYDNAKDLMSAIERNAGAGEKEFFAQQAREANATANELRRGTERISPMYNVTQGDFKRLTGMNYDARNKEHQRLFFDINARGKKGFGDFGTPEAMYDVVDGQVAATTPESRRRSRSQEDDRLARERIDAEMSAQDAAIRAQAEKNVAGELALDYMKNWGNKDIATDDLEKQRRQNYIYDLERDLKNDGSRTIDEPQMTVSSPAPVRRGSSAVSDAQNALAGAAGRFVSDKAKDVSDFLKKNLMTYNPYPKEERGADPDIQRGQFPIYPDENTGGMNATGSIEDFEKAQAKPPIPWALGIEKQLKKYRAKSTKDQMPQEEEGPTEVGIGPEKYQKATYVVPGSQAWEAMDQDQKMAMTIAALQRGESHKFFGGREQTTGGFLGMGGKKTGRFSVDTSDANVNQIARQLNDMLDKYDAGAMAQQQAEANPVVSAAVETGAGMGVQTGESKGFKKSNLPFNAADIITRLSKNKKFSTKADIPSDFEDAMEKWRESNAPENRYDQPLKLVVPGQGFDPETGSEGGMDSGAYQERSKRFSTRNELSQAIRNEFIKITGRTPKEESQADSNLLDMINRRERMKRGLSLDFDDVR
jgi:hypothetical protein